ncbi:MAG: hypothetical protein KAT32_03770 [Candidatus Moranbacteria bacterium]|nr:hypothetical protein [Candidatus Moranbacteria bacterium]
MKKSNEEAILDDNSQIIIEKIIDRIDLFHDDLSTKIEKNSQAINSLENRFDHLESDVNDLKVGFCELDETVAKLDEKVTKMDGKIDVLQEDMKDVNNKVDILQEDVTEIKHKLSEKIDREEFNVLEKRLIKLERLVMKRV